MKYIYTVSVQCEEDRTAADMMWSMAYTSLAAAKAAVEDDIKTIRDAEELYSAPMPEWKLSTRRSDCETLTDSEATDREYTVMETDLVIDCNSSLWGRTE